MAKAPRIIIIFLFLFIFLPVMAHAATLSLSPNAGSFEVGDRVSVRVVASSSTSLNAVSGTVSFPTSLFTVESVSKAGSIIDFWVTEPSVSKASGTVKFEGVALGGFNGSSGTVATLHLRAAKTGSASLAFQSGQILANDGAGTNITGTLAGATYTIKPASPKPVPIPEEEIEPEVTQPSPSLEAPEIMLGSKYGAGAIIGTSIHGKVQVLITFVARDGVKIFIAGVSDNEGGFGIIVPTSLKRGEYTVSAVVIKEDKTSSDPSNTIVVSVGSIFSDIGWEVSLLIILLVLCILYLLLRIHTHLKDKGPRSPIPTKEEMRQAEETIRKSFKALQDDVTDRSRGIINPVERANIEELKKDINSTEALLEKEIKNISEERK